MRTLAVLSSESAQLDYKRKVPFAHIPDELLAQWASYSAHFYQSGWFSRGLDSICLDALICFDKKIQKFTKNHSDVEDVPIVFNNEDWGRIGIYAQDLLQVFRRYTNLNEVNQ
jgi:hypothetical protein